MAKLKAATRNQLPSSAFGLPQALLRDESRWPTDRHPPTPSRTEALLNTNVRNGHLYTR
jgi:hypothetical protein